MIGLDEVGRGCFAGPLVVAAVSLSEDHTLSGLDDSKRLSAARRATLEQEIKYQALSISLAWCDAPTIDSIGLGKSLELCFQSAFSRVSKLEDDTVIVDGQINYLSTVQGGFDVKSEVAADSRFEAVMAASIIAKQARDRYMSQMDLVYPKYQFKQNVGYGTQTHRQAIANFGVCSLHRLSIRPLQIYASTNRWAKS